LDAPADPADWRMVRELQNKAQGAPELPPDPGSQGTMLLSATELGASAGLNNTLQAQDYDALYSLLQRFRDELAGMGLDYDKYMARLSDLKRKSEDLSDRLEHLHPLDGMKIHGTTVTSYQNLDILGHRAFKAPGPPTYLPKPKDVGIRYEGGLTRVDVAFDFTRGPLSAIMELNLLSVWSGVASLGMRHFNIEIRTPVVLQFGMIDANLTPLTLWRNEDPYPFEPEPFKSRRDRVRKDFEMVPDKSRVTGARLSTQLHLFNTFDLDLESTSALISYAFSPFIPAGSPYLLPDATNFAFSYYTNYLEAWRASFDLPSGFGMSYQGALFFDDTLSRPNGLLRGMQELTQSGDLRYKSGGFFADAEYAGSAYQAGYLLTSTNPDLLVDSAVVVNAGMQGKWGHVKAYGRSVGAGFHASGAQVRTQDANFNFLSPLMGEITQIDQNGNVSIGNANLGVPPNPEHHWFNKGIIPPGTQVGLPAPPYANPFVFENLLPYDFLNDISPYGMATPNRQGFGMEGDYKLFDGMLVPKLGFDMATQITPGSLLKTSRLWQIDSVGNTMGNVASNKPLLSNFSYQQIRAGLDVNFKLVYPVKLSAGYTMHDTRSSDLGWVFGNKDLNALGDGLKGPAVALPFVLSSTLLQTGIEVHPTDTVTVAIGYNHVDASGFSDVLWVSNSLGVSYDQLAYSVFFTINEVARVDILYEELGYATKEYAYNAFTSGMGMVRVQIDF
jgi:hypothetical protein